MLKGGLSKLVIIKKNQLGKDGVEGVMTFQAKKKKNAKLLRKVQ
jgi:hypothetical protein